MPHLRSHIGNPGNRDNDQWWVAGVFYVNRNDPRLLVEKRSGLGVNSQIYWARYHKYWAGFIINIGRDRPRSRSVHLGRLIGRRGNPNICDKKYAQPQCLWYFRPNICDKRLSALSRLTPIESISEISGLDLTKVETGKTDVLRLAYVGDVIMRWRQKVANHLVRRCPNG